MTMTIYCYLDQIDTFTDAELDMMIRLAEDGYDLNTDISLILNNDETVADYATQVKHQEWQADEMNTRFHTPRTKSLRDIAEVHQIRKEAKELDKLAKSVRAKLAARIAAHPAATPAAGTVVKPSKGKCDDLLWHAVCRITTEKMGKRLTADGWDILHHPYNSIEYTFSGAPKSYLNQIDARIELLQFFDEGAEATKKHDEEQRIFNLTFHTVEEPLGEKIKRRIAK